MAEQKKDFVIDVAKERKYQNQNDEYYKEFLKWRTDPSNPYGYKFVHDTREHTYVDGEGYLEKKPYQAEKKALGKCCAFIGLIMLVMLLVDVLGLFLGRYIFGINNLYNGFYSDFSDAEVLPSAAGYTLMAFQLLKYVIPIAIFAAFTKIPHKVALPSGEMNYRLCGSGIVILLAVMAIGRIADYVFMEFLNYVNIDPTYSGYIKTDDVALLIIYITGKYLLIPILTEILFRGCFLQFFRQFGDFFAILITSAVSCLCSYDIVHCGYIFSISLVLGLFTIKSGSIKTTVIMSIALQLVTFAVNFTILSANNIPGAIVETTVCLVLFLFCILVHFLLTGKGEWSFNIEGDVSEMTTMAKVRAAMTSTPLILWVLLAVALTVISLRTI